MIKILHNSALFRVKNANFFAEFFGENILKNHNIGPRSQQRYMYVGIDSTFQSDLCIILNVHYLKRDTALA
jgi:hypothetical protein